MPLLSLALAASISLFDIPVGNSATWLGVAASVLAITVLLATVVAVLEHAESLAAHLGEPYGTVLLTVAVTTVEVAVIISMMLIGENNPTLARETVFATVMIACAGIVGICLTMGGLLHNQQDLKRQGTNAFLGALTALTILTLILPNYTLASPAQSFSSAQLIFVSLSALLLYASFVFTQTVRHRNHFLDGEFADHAMQRRHPLSRNGFAMRSALLLVGLTGIVLLADEAAIGVETWLHALSVTNSDAIIGAFIAMLVLLPEALAAIRAALHNQLQRSLNIAFGSALATIGLTIPVIGVASVVTGREILLGLPAADVVLLVLILFISTQSFSTGRTTLLTGLVHLIVFIAFLLLLAIP